MVVGRRKLEGTGSVSMIILRGDMTGVSDVLLTRLGKDRQLCLMRGDG